MKELFKLYNTFSRRVEVFAPQNPDQVTLYTCGPTVYGDQHIGNYRTFIFEDVLVKALRRFGYATHRVMNITDVGHLTSDADEGEDKLEVGARRDGSTAWDVAKKYEARFLTDLTALNIETPNPLIRATDTIPEQIALIQALEAKGFTYQTSDGVYFDSSQDPKYGELARLDIAGLQAGARVAIDEKHTKTDFALWKFSKEPGERQMEWESPWGVGFPGWHIECSAIIRKALGDTIDIHCGGVDHIPVHHTNEIAQSEAATDKPLARFWCHSEFLLIDGGKMSKSLGNIYTLEDIVTKGFDPISLRLLSYSALYRHKLNFTWEILEQAEDQLRKLRRVYQQTEVSTVTPAVTENSTSFTEALADDLNMPAALAIVWSVVNGTLTIEEKHAFLADVEAILSLNLSKKSQVDIPVEISDLLQQRQAARDAKNYALSDSLRTKIENAGYAINDTATGQEIEKTRS